MSRLALHGGEAVRRKPMPSRQAMGTAEQAAVARVFAHYQERGVDPGYQGHFETLYTDAFVDYLGEDGYADAVATGTAALFVALAALDLPAGSRVLCSAITDPGTLSAIILNGLVPKLVDCAPGSYNIGPEQLAARVADGDRAVVVVHAAGLAVDMDGVMAVARRTGLTVVEDCSQAHGAQWNGRKVGVFGDVAAFSTMYRKNHVTGGSGGVVFSKDRDLYHRCLAHADRGKQVWDPAFDEKDPGSFLFPALNLHTDELSCAIGLSSLSRLDDTIARRRAYAHMIVDGLAAQSSCCRATAMESGSPFFLPVFVDSSRLTCSKTDFARALAAEGIPLNPHYRYVASDWAWLQRHCADSFACDNARAVRDGSFNLLFHEAFGPAEAADTLSAFSKVERHFQKD